LTDVKKSQIIEGMERALLSKSYDRLTIDDVAKEAEYSKKTIYSYFNSKDEIYLELILRKFKLLNEVLEKAVNRSGKTGIKKIEVLGEAYYTFAKEYPEYMQSIINYETNRKLESSQVDKTLEQFDNDLEKSFLMLVNAINEGITEGDIPGGLEPVSTAILLWSTINGFIMLELKKGEYLKNNCGKDSEKLFSFIMEMVLRSLKIQG
jgi:AcrR family transcriptional regulator